MEIYQKILKQILFILSIKISSDQIKLASSVTNAQNNVAITVFGGTKLFVESRVSDKSSGDIGSPIQFDTINKIGLFMFQQLTISILS